MPLLQLSIQTSILRFKKIGWSAPFPSYASFFFKRYSEWKLWEWRLRCVYKYPVDALRQYSVFLILCFLGGLWQRLFRNSGSSNYELFGTVAHTFSRNLGGASKFKASEGWHEACSILKTENTTRHRAKFDLCTPVVGFQRLNGVLCKWYGKFEVVTSNLFTCGSTLLIPTCLLMFTCYF